MSNVNIVGVDPGNNTGIAILTLSDLDLSLLEINTVNIVLSDNCYDTQISEVERPRLLRNICYNLNAIYNPVVVAVESAFSNASTPNVIVHLTRYTTTIFNAFHELSPFTKLYRFSPKHVKKYSGAGGKADKNDMRSNMMTITEITNICNLANMTEHEIDAVAIGYVALMDIREYPHKLVCY